MAISCLYQKTFYKKQEDAIDRLWRFKLFLSEYKVTKKYGDDLNHLSAIAQHYGIPTDLLDFTKSPEIALFFATHSKKDLTGKNGVIICLNQQDFEECIKIQEGYIKEFDVAPPYFVDDQISSLWRLQAQCGCFMQLNFGNIEALYPFDKIIFPHKEFSSNICERDVYPEDKSGLEMLLDNYFAAERIYEGQKRLARFAEEMSIEVKRIPKQPEYKYAKSKKQHKSWRFRNTLGWEYNFSETHSKRKPYQFDMSIKCTGSFEDDVEIIRKQLASILRNIKKERFIEPNIKFIPKLRSIKSINLVNSHLKYIWDGMRNLPYAKKHILYAMAKYLVLDYYELCKKINHETLLHDPILIEMSNSFGAHCRCNVSRLNLYWALREDILEIQHDSLPKSKSPDVLLFIQKARLVFNFNELVFLFYHELIPSLMVRSKHSDKPLLFFSPLYIDRLGYA